MNVTIPQSKLNATGGNRATNRFTNGQNAGLSGVGVPGGFKRGAGSDVAKGAGFQDSGVAAKSVLGTAKEGVNGARDTVNQSKGVQKSDGATAKGTASMKKELDALGARGNMQGVQKQDGATAKQTATMKNSLEAFESTRGNAVGVNKEDTGVHLTPEQQKEFKESIRNPAVNHDQKDKDKEEAKHMFDFAKPKELKPIVFPPDKIVVPKPPKH